MTLICDNHDTFHISPNLLFHERIKHINIDCHFIREKIVSRDIKIEFVNSKKSISKYFH